MHSLAHRRRAGLAKAAMTGLVILGALAAPVAAHAQGSSWPGRIEILLVRSQTLPLDAFLRGDKNRPEVLLGGELRLPFGTSGRVPAVILIHGSGGIGAGSDMWAHILNEAGIAAFKRWCTRQIQGEMALHPKLLCDDRLATDGIRAPGRQHPVQHRHADGSLSLLGREAAGSQTRSDQRLVTTHRRFH